MVLQACVILSLNFNLPSDWFYFNSSATEQELFGTYTVRFLYFFDLLPV